MEKSLEWVLWERDCIHLFTVRTPKEYIFKKEEEKKRKSLVYIYEATERKDVERSQWRRGVSGLNDQLTDGTGSWASAKGAHQSTCFNDSPVPECRRSGRLKCTRKGAKTLKK